MTFMLMAGGWNTHFILLCTSFKKSFKQEVVFLEIKIGYCYDHFQKPAKQTESSWSFGDL